MPCFATILARRLLVVWGALLQAQPLFLAVLRFESWSGMSSGTAMILLLSPGSARYQMMTAVYERKARSMVKHTRGRVVSALCTTILLGGLSGCDSDSDDSSTSDGQVSSYSLVVDDMNGDGRQDIVTANIERSASGNPGSVKVILQQGGVNFGEFDKGVFYEMGFDTLDAAVGDLNIDGKLDVLASSRSGSSLSLRYQIAAEPGILGDEVELDTSPLPGAMVVADINGDAFNDIVVSGSSVVIWLYHRADPDDAADVNEFRFGGTLDISGQTLAVADFNGDARLDIVVGSSATEISVLLQDSSPVASGVFLPPAVYEVGVQPFDIAVGDLNSDGRLDIAVVNRGEDNDPSSATVAVLLQKFTPLDPGEFREAEQYAIGGRGTQIVIADLNDDGLADIAATNDLSVDGGVSVLLQAATGTPMFESELRVRATSPWGLGAADFNNDKLIDLAIANFNGASIMYQNSESPGEFLTPELVGGGNNGE
jgi:hypothetical protein